MIASSSLRHLASLQRDGTHHTIGSQGSKLIPNRFRNSAKSLEFVCPSPSKSNIDAPRPKYERNVAKSVLFAVPLPSASPNNRNTPIVSVEASTKSSPLVPSPLPSRLPFAFETFDANTVIVYRPSSSDPNCDNAPVKVSVTWVAESIMTFAVNATKALSD